MSNRQPLRVTKQVTQWGWRRFEGIWWFPWMWRFCQRIQILSNTCPTRNERHNLPSQYLHLRIILPSKCPGQWKTSENIKMELSPIMCPKPELCHFVHTPSLISHNTVCRITLHVSRGSAHKPCKTLASTPHSCTSGKADTSLLWLGLHPGCLWICLVVFGSDSASIVGCLGSVGRLCFEDGYGLWWAREQTKVGARGRCSSCVRYGSDLKTTVWNSRRGDHYCIDSSYTFPTAIRFSSRVIVLFHCMV